MELTMSEQSSGTAPPGFFTRLGIAATHLMIPLHTGLIVTYYLLHTLRGDDSAFVNVFGFVLPWLFIPSALMLPLALWHRSRKIILLASIPAALFLLTYGQLFLPSLPATKTGHAFTVMTYNVLFSNPHANRVIAVIDTHDPDILALHELHHTTTELEMQLSEEYPYYRIEPGLGIFSRYPIKDYMTFTMDGESKSLAQQCVLDIGGHQTTLISVHPAAPPIKSVSPFGLPLAIPLGMYSENRDAHLNSLFAHLEEIEGPLILVGDFNLSDQESHYTELTKNLRDAHRESGWGLGFSFTNYRRLGVPVWRIDYVFHSPDLAALHTTVGDYGGSDHRPVIARLGFLEAK
jgi:endonuclease/exonuclease/phosphatase (EEP) superfamily protein YafD